MAKTLTIAGSNFLPFYQTNSVKIKETVRKTNVMNFKAVTQDISDAPQQGAELIYKDGSRFLFGGFISRVQPEELGKGQQFVFSVEVSDYSSIFNSKVARRAYVNKTLKEIVDDLMSTYVDSTYGFTTTNVQTGPTIETVAFDHLSLRRCFEKLSKLTGYVWWTDYERNLFFQTQTTDPAPEDLRDSNTNISDIQIAYDASQVRNSIIVIGSADGVQSLELIEQTFTGDGETISWELEEKPSEVVSVVIDGVARNYNADITTSPVDTFAYNFSGKALKLLRTPIPHGSSATGSSGYTISNTAWVGRDVLVDNATELVVGVVLDITELSSSPDGDIVVGIRDISDRSGADLITKTVSVSALVLGQNTVPFDESLAITRGNSYFVYVGRSISTTGTIKIKEETLASNDEYTSSDSGGTFSLGFSNKLIDIKILTSIEPIPGADNVVGISYYPRIPVVEVKKDPSSIAFFAALDSGDGIYEYTIKEGTITSLEEASRRAIQELEEYSMPLVVGSFTTRTGLLSGGSIFKPGQYITVNMPTYGINTDTAFLIQEVSISVNEDGTNTEYIYTVKFGGKMVGLKEFLETLASREADGTEKEDAAEIITIEHVTDTMVFEDTSATHTLESGIYEYGGGGSPQGKWNLSQWA